MSDSSNGYHISFFKPTTTQATANRNMVVWLVLIWALAIFGFQILLRVLEKPTPEPAYIGFQEVWGNIENGSAGVEELQVFGRASLSVLSKISITANDKAPLNNALSWSVFNLASDSLKESVVAKVKDFEKIKSEITNISDEGYIASKISLSSEIAPLLGLETSDIRSKILPLELESENMQQLAEDTKGSLPTIMEKYLVHNQSVLTDTKFLGFPFHYFYTAIFLLVLFVGLCWMYCVRTDKLNAKLNIVD